MNSFLNENLISAKDASTLSGYNPDYLSRLCRSGKIRGEQIGRAWFIERASLDEFIGVQAAKKAEFAENLSREREEEYRLANQAVSPMTPSMEKRTEVAVNTVMSLLSKMAIPVAYPVFGTRLASVALTALVLGASTLLAGSGLIAASGNALVDAAFGARALVLDTASDAGMHAARVRGLLAARGAQEAGDARSLIARATDPRVESFPAVLADRAAERPEPVTVIAYVTSSSTLAADGEASLNELKATLAAVVADPLSSALIAYASVGTYMYDAHQEVLALHVHLVDAAGGALLSVGTGVRDGADAAGASYARGLYAYVDAAHRISPTVLGAVYGIGDATARSLASGIERAPAGYDASVEAFAVRSQSVGDSIATASEAFGKGSRETVVALLTAEDRAIATAIAPVRLAIMDANASAARALARAPFAIGTEVTKLASNVERSSFSLPASPFAALGRDGGLGGFFARVGDSIAQAFGTMRDAVLAFFGTAGADLAVVPGEDGSFAGPSSTEPETGTAATATAGDTVIVNHGPVTNVHNEYSTFTYAGVSQEYVDEQIKRVLYISRRDTDNTRDDSLTDINGESGTDVTLTDSAFIRGTITDSTLSVLDTTINGLFTVNGSSIFNGGITLDSASAFDFLSVGRNATTTIRGDGLASIFSGGIQSTFVEASSYLAGPYILATSTTATSAFSGNIAVGRNATLGTSAADLLTVNSQIASSLVPSANNTYDLGSPGNFWRRTYVDELIVNNLFAASTSIGGTVSSVFTLNSDNATNDLEDSSLLFNRGVATPNALLTWNATAKRFEFNMPVFSADGLFTNATTTSFATTNFSLGGSTFTSLLGNGLQNVGGALSIDTNSFVGNFFQQNGNSFGTDATLGTNDAYGLSFETNNAPRISILADGNVGIGTNAPKAKFQVGGSGSLYTVGPAENFDLAYNTYYDAGASAWKFIQGSRDATMIEMQQPGSQNIAFYASNNAVPAEDGVISWTKIFGAGLSGIFSPVKLTAGLNGHGASTLNSAGNLSVGAGYVGTAAPTNGAIIQGNVGIGTTAPGATLDVAGNIRVNASGQHIQLWNDNVGLARSTNNLILGGFGGIDFKSSNTTGIENQITRMVITSAGNVGIGTTTPSNILSVQLSGTPAAETPYFAGYNQNGVLEAALRNGNIANTYGGQLYLADPAGNYTKLQENGGYPQIVVSGNGFNILTNGANPRVSIGNSYISLTSTAGGAATMSLVGNNVGIGSTTPYAKLSVKGTGLTTGVNFQTTNSADSPLFSILDNGNVGIGTTTPAAKLQINLDSAGVTQISAGTGLIVANTGIASDNASIEIKSGGSGSASVFFGRAASNDGGISYVRTADRMDFATNGVSTPDMSLSSLGNLGIGSTTPYAKLSVVGTVAASPVQVIQGAAAQTGNLSEWQNSNRQQVIQFANTGRIALNLSPINADTILSFSGGNNERVDTTATATGILGRVINGMSGNINGIAITTESRYAGGINSSIGVQSGVITNTSGNVIASGRAFFANSPTLISGGLITNAYGIYIDSQKQAGVTNGYGVYSLGANDINYFAGSVGIGTSNPTGRLSIVSAGVGDTLLLRNSANTGNLFRVFDNSNNGLLSIYDSSNVERIRLAANSTSYFNAAGVNFGIGTSSPVYKLDVFGGTGIVAQFSGRVIGGDAVNANEFVTLSQLGFATSSLNAFVHTGNSFGTAAILGTNDTSDLQFETNDTTRLTITSAGNVGIGTTTPATKLDVYATGGAQARFYGRNTVGSISTSDNSGTILIGGSQTSTFGAGIGYDGSGRDLYIENFDSSGTGRDIIFRSKGAELLRIVGEGNVGIGTTSPYGKLVVSNTIGTIPSFIVEDDASDASPFLIDFQGRVSIGSTLPAGKLRVEGDISVGARALSGGATSYIGTHNGSLALGTNDTSWMGFIRAANSDEIAFATFNQSTGGGERLRISSTGNVGIGTSTPSSLLSVAKSSESSFTGTGQGAFGIYSSDDIANQYRSFTFNNVSGLPIAKIGVLRGSAGSVLTFGTSNAYASGITTTGMVIDQNGNVGIGTTSPSAVLDVHGTGANTDFRVTRSGTTNYFFVKAPGGGSADLGYNGTTNLSLTASGNVGIGTTSPAGKLAVEGSGGSGVDVLFKNSSGNLRLNLIAEASAADINFGNSASYVGNGRIRYDNSTNSFALTTNGGERLRITNTGNVGIGTTSPAALLSVAGNGYLTGNLGLGVINNGYKFIARTGTDNNIAMRANGGDAQLLAINDADSTYGRLRIDASSLLLNASSAGTIGIGTTTPATSGLHIYGSTALTLTSMVDSGVAVEFRTTGDPGSSKWAQYLSNRTTTTRSDFNLYSYGGVGVVQTWQGATGNVGIGSTTPYAKLSVKGAGTTTGVNFQTTNSVDAPLFTILDSGNVGVGTANPVSTATFEVVGNTNPLVVLRRDSTTPGFAARLGFRVSTTGASPNSYIEGIRLNSGQDSALAFGTGMSGTPSEGMRLDASGNLGIGTTSPFGRLSVTGAGTGTGLALLVADSSNIPLFTVNDAGATTIARNANSTTEALTISNKSGGAVALTRLALSNGTSNGDLQYTMYGTGYTNTSPYGLTIANWGELSTLGAANGLVIGTRGSGDPLVFGTNNTERVRIDGTTGNVGIGTTSPAAALDVNGKVRLLAEGNVVANPTLSFGDGTTGFFNNGGTISMAVSGALKAQLTSTSYDIRVAAKNAGVGNSANVRFDATPSATLPVFAFGGDSSTGLGTASLGTGSLIAGGVNVLNFSSTGNVGIGTSSPTTALNIEYDGGTTQLEGFRITNTGTPFGGWYPQTLTIRNANGGRKSVIQQYENTNGGGFLTLGGGALQFGSGDWAGTQNVRLTISGAGNVGIGTTTPSNLLSLSSGTNTIASIDSTLTTGSSRLYFTESGTLKNYFQSIGSAHATPDFQNDLQIVSSSGDISLWPGSSQAVTFKSSGNVGIGTTTPTAQLHTTGTVRFSNFAAGSLQTDADGNVTASSDERLKNVDGTFTRGLADIMAINPIRYHWKASTGFDTQNTYTGFSAQNVQSAIPEAVDTDNRGYLTLSDRPILAASINAIKELSGRTDMLSIASTTLSLRITDVETKAAEAKAAIEREKEENRRLIASSTETGMLTVTGSASARSFLVPATAMDFVIGSSTESVTLPTEVLAANGKADLYKMAGYGIASVQALAARTDLLSMRIDEFESRLAELEASSSPIAAVTDMADITATALRNALKSFGILIENGIAQFETLAFRQLAVTKGEDGSSSAGSETILAGNTVLEVENAFVLPTSKIFVTFTGPVESSWYVSEKKEGGFRVTLAQAQSADVSFDYFILQTEGQIASPAAAQSPAPLPTPVPTPAPVPFEPVFPGSETDAPVVPEVETPIAPTPTLAPTPAPAPAPTPDPIPTPAAPAGDQNPPVAPAPAPTPTEPTPAPAPEPAPAPAPEPAPAPVAAAPAI